jgi:splicing factor 3B subunit 4
MFVATVNVYVPKDRVTNLHQGYGFVEFRSEEDADYVSIYLFCDFTLLLNLPTLNWQGVYLCRHRHSSKSFSQFLNLDAGYKDTEYDQVIWQTHPC